MVNPVSYGPRAYRCALLQVAHLEASLAAALEGTKAAAESLAAQESNLCGRESALLAELEDAKAHAEAAANEIARLKEQASAAEAAVQDDAKQLEELQQQVQAAETKVEALTVRVRIQFVSVDWFFECFVSFG